MAADPGIDADLQLALEVADDAAAVALDLFRTGLAVTWKADGTPVTDADRSVERQLVEALGIARPADAVLGEEFGTVGAADRQWVLDPVDGTKQFVAGDPNWRVHVTLEVGGVGRVASVTSPALGLCWWAAEGRGAYESPWPRADSRATRLAVSTTTDLADAAIGVLGRGPSVAQVPTGSLVRTSPMPLVDLVRGGLDVVVAEGFSAWDHAPWIVITREAGGRFTDVRGGSASDGGGGVYSNALLHHPVLSALDYPTGPGTDRSVDEL